MTAGTAHGPIRAGFSLMEIAISVALLGIILVALAGLTFQTTQRSAQLSDASARQALLLEEVNRLSAVPYERINAEAGCDSLASGGDRFERCVQVAQIGTTRRVTIVLRSAKLNRPDSVVFMIAQTNGSP